MDLKPVQDLFETEMDRKEFLLYVSTSVLALIGIANLIKSLTPAKKQDEPTTKKAGYGSSPYGR